MSGHRGVTEQSNTKGTRGGSGQRRKTTAGNSFPVGTRPRAPMSELLEGKKGPGCGGGTGDLLDIPRRAGTTRKEREKKTEAPEQADGMPKPVITVCTSAHRAT